MVSGRGSRCACPLGETTNNGPCSTKVVRRTQVSGTRRVKRQLAKLSQRCAGWHRSRSATWATRSRVGRPPAESSTSSSATTSHWPSARTRSASWFSNRKRPPRPWPIVIPARLGAGSSSAHRATGVDAGRASIKRRSRSALRRRYTDTSATGGSCRFARRRASSVGVGSTCSERQRAVRRSRRDKPWRLSTITGLPLSYGSPNAHPRTEAWPGLQRDASGLCQSRHRRPAFDLAAPTVIVDGPALGIVDHVQPLAVATTEPRRIRRSARSGHG